MLPLLIDLAVKGTILLLLACAGALLLRRASSAARHLHWQLALAGLAALPLAAVLSPRVAVPVGPLSAWLADGAAAPATDAANATLAPARSDALAARGARRDLPQRAATDDARPLVRAEHPASPSAPAAEPTPAPQRVLLVLRLLDQPRVLLPALWAAGAALVLGALAIGLLRARALARRAVPVADPGWLDLADRVRRQLALRRVVSLRRVPDAVVPMTLGWRRPIVLLPADADAWSLSRRRHVLLHELAHVRRGDWPGQVLAQVALALWWWQPLAWIAVRELRKSREEACDDQVLAAGSRASEYADHLLAIAASRGAGVAGATALAMARRSQLEGRLLAVLDQGRRRAGPGRRRAAVAATFSALLVAGLACVQPQADEPAEAAPFVERLERADFVLQPAAREWVVERATLEPDAVRIAPAPELELVVQPRPAVVALTAPLTLSVNSPDIMVRAPRLVLNLSPTLQDAPAPPAAPEPPEFPDFDWPALDDNAWLIDTTWGDRQSSTWIWSDDDASWKVSTQGGLAPDETGTRVGWIDEDGWIVIEHGPEGAADRLEARGSAHGPPVWSGTVGGQAVAGDAARAEAERLMPEVFAVTGLFASERVAQLVAEGGPVAVLEAARNLPDGRGGQHLVHCLLTEHDLDTPDFAAALELAAQATHSDGDLAELLVCVGPDALGDPDLLEPLFRAVEAIESDADQSETLEALLCGGAAEAPAVARGLRAVAAGLESDACAAEVLAQVPANRLRDPTVREAFLAALDTIESDACAAEVLAPLLDQRGLKGESLAALLAALAHGIDSDAYAAEVLQSLPERARGDTAAREALLAALGTIESDACLAEALGGLLDGATPAVVAALLPAATAGLDSDAWMAELLERVPGEVLLDAAARPAFDAALATIQSASYRQEVLEHVELLEDA